MSEIITTDLTSFDGKEIVAGLNRYLRLRTTPIGMKLFASKEEMEAVPLGKGEIVRQGRKIARGTDRSLIRNHGRDAALQHGLDQGNGFGAGSGCAAPQ